MLFEAAASADKTFRVVDGANHYCTGQPERLAQATEMIRGWLIERRLLEG